MGLGFHQGLGLGFRVSLTDLHPSMCEEALLLGSVRWHTIKPMLKRSGKGIGFREPLRVELAGTLRHKKCGNRLLK